MLDILDVLYNYIQENRIAYYLNGDPEYCLAGRRMDEAEEWLEANLPPEARARLARLAAACTAYPDLNDKELQDSYHVMGAPALVKAMLLPGEYAAYLQKVQSVCGFDIAFEDRVEEAKN